MEESETETTANQETKQSLLPIDVLAGKRGLRILSIDGAGTKGVIPIEILHKIEERLGKKVILFQNCCRKTQFCLKQICELFDIIAGSSTGGIIALALVMNNVPLK